MVVDVTHPLISMYVALVSKSIKQMNMIKVLNRVTFFVVVVCLFFFETGFFYIALAVLELTL